MHGWRFCIPFGLIGLVLLLNACQSMAFPFAPVPSPTALPPTLPATYTPLLLTRTPLSPPPLTPAPRTQVSQVKTNERVEIALFDANGRTGVTAAIGSLVRLTIAFRPMRDVVTQWSDGTTTKYSEGWSPNDLAQMRYCAGLGRTCPLPERWLPFAPEQSIDVPVDWVGQQDYGVTAQFRDASGKVIPSGNTVAETGSNWLAISGTLDERTPVASQPPRIQTAIAQSKAAFPVSGSIQVGQGSITGGKAGTTIQVTVKFQATSPAGTVTQMRVKQDPMGICLTPQQMSDASWEPFIAQKDYPVSVAINFISFKLHVQYRDDKGNLSPVYCGDIAVEGHP